MNIRNHLSINVTTIPYFALALGVVVWLVFIPVLAAESGGDEINWFELGMGLFGGLSLFLFGMEQMSEGLKAAAGDALKVILAKLTKNRFMGALTGAFVTAILNSSSVTTVLVVGFITAGIMTMGQSIGVIMGANIGSTVTAQIVAFNVTQYAPLMITIGFGMLFISKREQVKHYGSMIMGLGLVFFGMGLMSDAMTPLRSYQPFLDLMIRMETPLLGILVGAVFTGLVQSSAATTGIAIVMASEGLMTLPAGIALAFGSNIGTCVTALLAAIGKPREAVRAAVAHILFNVAGVLIWVGFITQLADFVVWLSPSHSELEGSVRMAAEVPRQIANAHTVFNVANTLLFIGFTGVFARLVERLVPAKPVEEEKLIVRAKYLDEALISTPSLALDRVRLELEHLGEIIHSMLIEVRPAFLSKQREHLEEISKRDDQVDVLEEHILDYLGRIRQMELSEQQSRDFQHLMIATDNLEGIGDVIESDLVPLGLKALDENIEPSEITQHMFEELYTAVCQSVDTAVQAVKENDQRLAQAVIAMKPQINHLVDEVLQQQAGRISVTDAEYQVDLFRMEIDLIDKLKRIYSLAKRVARVVLPGELSAKAT